MDVWRVHSDEPRKGPKTKLTWTRTTIPSQALTSAEGVSNVQARPNDTRGAITTSWTTAQPADNQPIRNILPGPRLSAAKAGLKRALDRFRVSGLGVHRLLFFRVVRMRILLFGVVCKQLSFLKLARAPSEPEKSR